MQACTVRITDPPIHIHQQRINTGGIDVQRVAVTTMDTGSEGKRCLLYTSDAADE